MTVERIKRPHDTLSDFLLNTAVQKKRTLNRPWNRPGVSARFIRNWAIVLAVGWHAAFLVVLAPRRIPPPPRAVAPVSMAYLAADPASGEGRAVDGVRGVWSPVLFALPSKMGFSGLVLARELVQAPPLSPPENRSVVLPFLPSRGLEREAEGRGVGEQFGTRALTSLLPERGPVFPVGSAREARTALSFRFRGALGQPDLTPVGPDGTPGGKPWEAQAYMVADEEGRVTQVFLETPAPSEEWNRFLVRSLWRMKFEPGSASRSGRVSIRYLGGQQGGNGSRAEAG